MSRAAARKILRPARAPRTCAGCGKGYSRRNLVEAWAVQNHGHRLGWSKTTLKLCTRCSPAYAARRMLLVASQVVPRG